MSGQNLEALAVRLRTEPGVGQVTAFGTTLHVVGHDADALAATASRSRPKGSRTGKPSSRGWRTCSSA